MGTNAISRAHRPRQHHHQQFARRREEAAQILSADNSPEMTTTPSATTPKLLHLPVQNVSVIQALQPSAQARAARSCYALTCSPQSAASSCAWTLSTRDATQVLVKLYTWHTNKGAAPLKVPMYISGQYHAAQLGVLRSPENPTPPLNAHKQAAPGRLLPYLSHVSLSYTLSPRTPASCTYR